MEHINNWVGELDADSRLEPGTGYGIGDEKYTSGCGYHDCSGDGKGNGFGEGGEGIAGEDVYRGYGCGHVRIIQCPTSGNGFGILGDSDWNYI